MSENAPNVFVHESSYVDEPCEIGAGTMAVDAKLRATGELQLVAFELDPEPAVAPLLHDRPEYQLPCCSLTLPEDASW